MSSSKPHNPPKERPVDRTDHKAQVLAATDIVQLIGQTVGLKRRGKDYLGLCPFHSEKTPSFHVSPTRQFFHCFGCKEHGNAIDFIIKRDRVEFIDALRVLSAAAGIEMPRFGASKEKSGERQAMFDAHVAAVSFYEGQLAEPGGEVAREYLDHRGFTGETIKKFRVGLSLDAWDGLSRGPVGRKFQPQLLAGAGLLKVREKGNGFYDTFRNRLMFPIRDETGRTIAFGGREMPGSANPPKYLNSPETPLFNKSRCMFGLDMARQRIVETRTVAIVEGYTDVMMAHQYGVANVVSILGTGMTEGHVSILRRFADKIVLLFDADSAGDKAADRVVQLFLTQPIEIAVASMPEGMDPDELLIERGAAGFEEVIAGAIDVLTYQWKALSREFAAHPNDLTGQQKAVRQYLDLLANARGSGPVDPIRWGMALTRVSRLTGMPIDELNRQFKTAKSPQATKPALGQASRENYRTRGGSAAVSPASFASERAYTPAEQWPEADSSVGQEFGDDLSAIAYPESIASSETGSSEDLIDDLPLSQARESAERQILGLLLIEPYRWHDVQVDLHVEDFLGKRHRRIAGVYWSHQRDEGEPVFNQFLDLLGNLPGGAALGELAIELVGEVEGLSSRFENAEEQKAILDQTLSEALGYLTQVEKDEAQQKLLASLRRTSEGGEPGGDELSLFEALVKNNPSTNLRRLGPVKRSK